MLNHRWQKRILRATASNVDAPITIDGVYSSITEREHDMTNLVKDNEKLMEYLQKDNNSGHAHNMDMLIASLNVNQHLREAILNAAVTEDGENNVYIVRFPFGAKMIEYKINKKAVDGA